VESNKSDKKERLNVGCFFKTKNGEVFAILAYLDGCSSDAPNQINLLASSSAHFYARDTGQANFRWPVDCGYPIAAQQLQRTAKFRCSALPFLIFAIVQMS
jgi:hypothetical protein